MPPRTRNTEPTGSDALEGQTADKPPVGLGAFSPALEAAKTAMSVRMDTIAARIEGSLEELRLGQQALAEALGEVDGRSVPEPNFDALAALNQRIGALENATPDMSQVLTVMDAALLEHHEQLKSLSDKIDELKVGESGDLRREVEALGVAVDEIMAAQTGSMSAAMATDGFRTAGIERGQHILSAIWAVMSEVTGVGKHGSYRDATTKYQFRAWDDVQNAVGASFRRHGIMLQSAVLDKDVHWYEARNSSGNTVQRSAITLTMQYELTSLVDGSTVTFQAIGESKDTSDKGHAKAMTMAAKSMISQAFMLATGDEDPDQTRPGEDDAVEPNVRVPANENPAQRQAREAFEARRAAGRRAEQDGVAEQIDPHTSGQRQAGVADGPAYVETQEQVKARHAQPVDWDAERAVATGYESPFKDVSHEGAHHDLRMAAEGQAARRSPEDLLKSELGARPVAEEAPVNHGQDWQAAERAEQGDAGKVDRAVAALRALAQPGLDIGKINRILGLAKEEGLLDVQVSGASLQQHIIAASRTLAVPQ